VVLPVDTPLVTAGLLLELAAACDLASAPRSSPLPAAFAKGALPVLERRLAAGQPALHESLRELRAVRIEVDETLLTNVNTPDELRRLG
jgi:molybdopterin-guanine dinucleotide biosynthesis protein A